MTIATGNRVAVLLLVAGGTAAGVALARRNTAPPAPIAQHAVVAAPAPDGAQSPAAVETKPPVAMSASAPANPVAQADLAATVALSPGSGAPSGKAAVKSVPRTPLQSVAPTGEPPRVPLPVAREALRLVGADSAAEALWAEAINDPNLDADARSDLIEDLNEEGFVNSRNVTKDELPLVINRLKIIERLSPDAMDEVNAAAFQEAYKDLMIIYARLIG